MTDEALPTLRAACRLWQELDAPYNAAKVRLLLSQAYFTRGDDDAAALELDAAAVVFERLGAVGEHDQVSRLRGKPTFPDGLTEREAEVLRLVAVGHTNREIAALLVRAKKPLPGTWRTSSPRSVSRRGQLPPAMHTNTVSSRLQVVRTTHLGTRSLHTQTDATGPVVVVRSSVKAL